MLQELQSELAEQQPRLTRARDLCRQLCDKAKDPSIKADLRSKLTALEKDLSDTTKKLGQYFCVPTKNWVIVSVTSPRN